MKILIACSLDQQLVRSGLDSTLAYHPELANQSEDALLRALAEHLPDALVVAQRCPGVATLTAWRDGVGQPVHLVVRQEHAAYTGDSIPGVHLDRVLGAPGDLRRDVQCLGLAERRIQETATAHRLAPFGISEHGSGSLAGVPVTLVGAGIVNLMTALHLVDQGAEVEILEASPDPRSKPDWQCLGATHGGDAARMFCFTEADNYNEKAHVVYSEMDRVFRRTITDGGWLAVSPQNLTAREQTWIDRFHQLPRWRAEVFTEDIHGFNIASSPLWNTLRADKPWLFEGVEFTPGILRLYTQAAKVEAAKKLHTRLGSLHRALDPAELGRHHPACRPAIDAGEIAGGLEIEGFTLHIHTFVAKLLAYLEERGARLRWNHRVTALEWADDGSVAGLRLDDTVARSQHLVRSQHYVLSPGVYGNGLLAGLRSDGIVQGILGLWLRLPNVAPRLEHSVKIHREGHVGEDSNITVSTDPAGNPLLLLGSGYGFLGEHALDMASPQIDRLFEALEATARRFFPAAYQEAARQGLLTVSRRACVRPFTSTGLGTFEVMPTAEGGRLVVASGHNTGGFTQAPVVSEAVGATLEGRCHPMQALYDPQRHGTEERAGSSADLSTESTADRNRLRRAKPNDLEEALA